MYPLYGQIQKMGHKWNVLLVFFGIVVLLPTITALVPEAQIVRDRPEDKPLSTESYGHKSVAPSNPNITKITSYENTTMENSTDFLEITTESGPDEHAQYLLRLSNDIYKYGMTCVLVFGAIGNTLVLVVFLKGSSGGSTSSMYLIVLAILDQTVIFFAVFGSHVIRSFTGFDYIRWHRSTCKIAYFIIVLCSQTSFYLVATMSLERALVMFKPLKFLHVFTKKRVGIAIGLIFLAFVIKNSLMFWTQGAVYNENQTAVVSECGITKGPLYHYAVEVRPWLDYVITFLAAAVIMVANLVIIAAVWRSSRMQKKSATYRVNTQAQQMVFMLVAVSLSFLVLALPLQVVTILIPHNPNDVQNESEAYDKLLWSLGLLLSYANHGANFYVYCLSGRTFRQDLVQVLCCGKWQNTKHLSNQGLNTGTSVLSIDGKHTASQMPSTVSIGDENHSGTAESPFTGAP